MTDTQKTIERPETVAQEVLSWKIEIIDPIGRTISIALDNVLVDLSVLGPAAYIGSEVTNLVERLLDA